MTAARVKNEVERILRFEDPREAPAYSIRDAAHYLRMPAATLRSWVVGRSYPTTRGKRRFKPVIQLPDNQITLLSFYNLVEAHVLSAFRREHGVTLKAIRDALRFLSKRFESKHPLSEREFQTDGVSVLVEELGKLIDASAQGQHVMREVVQEHLRRIDRDTRGIVSRLYPFTRNYPSDDGKKVMIDPRIAFGRPVLRGTRIPTAVIAERYKAGESIIELAQDYGRAQNEIEEALRCELRTEAA